MSESRNTSTKTAGTKREKKAGTRNKSSRCSTAAKAEPHANAAAEQGRGAVADRPTKKQICIDLLSRAEGATLRELEEATGWQSHSVRGFLSGEVRKRMNRQLVSEQNEEGERHYRIVEAEAAP